MSIFHSWLMRNLTSDRNLLEVRERRSQFTSRMDRRQMEFVTKPFPAFSISVRRNTAGAVPAQVGVEIWGGEWYKIRVPSKL